MANILFGGLTVILGFSLLVVVFVILQRMTYE